jgi:hypothetical protein
MRTLILTEDEISVLKMALDSEKNVQYNDTDENHIKQVKKTYSTMTQTKTI